jgi:hypothetical protein
MSVLAGILHEKKTSAELGQLITALADQIHASSVPLHNPTGGLRVSF